MDQEKDTIVLDLETLKTFDEVGGFNNNEKMGVSVVGVYSYNRDQYRVFRVEEFSALLELFKNAKRVIGFNSISFDFVVLQPYFKDFSLSQIPHLDILDEIVKSLGHRLKLETVALSTLGYGKSGSGLDAIKYHRSGDWDSLIKYCLDDVKVTKEVYDYGLNHGHIWYQNAGQKTKININWGNGSDTIVADIVKNALASGQQLEIEYMDDSGKVTNRKIDIQRINGDKIRAYCHLRQALRVFDMAKIKQVKTVGQMDSWQNTLI